MMSGGAILAGLAVLFSISAYLVYGYKPKPNTTDRFLWDKEGKKTQYNPNYIDPKTGTHPRYPWGDEPSRPAQNVLDALEECARRKGEPSDYMIEHRNLFPEYFAELKQKRIADALETFDKENPEE